MTFTFPLDRLPDLPPDELKNLVGGKAANLGVMLGPELRLPVPPGFVITTEACRAFLAGGWPDGLDDEIRARTAEIEAAVGRRFGSASDPLLVSVRSGAPISMPGMMDTILNLGLTDGTEPGLAAAAGGDAAFAADCRTRLRTMFRDIVGIDEPPDDPWRQLRLAVEAVFRSWNSDRAKAYRAKERIPDDLGTAVTVQAMVFGNLGPDSATGVAFTRNPATGEAGLYGDVLFDAQGEDVVAGTHATEPVSALDHRLPVAARALREAADRLERHYADLCDIEFTVERGRLWMLQVRIGKRSPQAALRMAVEMAGDPDFPLDRRGAVERVARILADPPKTTTGRSGYLVPVTSGLGASPGLASGEIMLDPAAAAEAADAGRTVILVRAETSPEDVHGMAKSAGILTARGGLASHAAVVARGWGIPAVVGASEVVPGDGVVEIGDRRFAVGDVISIDGSTGEVFAGSIPGATEPVPEAKTLLSWAAELGVPIGADDAGTGASRSRPANLDDAIRRLSTKGFGTRTTIADALLAPEDEVGRLLDQLAVDGIVASVAGAFRLTDAGKERAAELVSADRSAWGTEPAASALDAFLDLDRRMKDAVTAWQLRPKDGGDPELNDHSDAGYDARILDTLEAIGADARAWLAPLEHASRRLSGYRERLARALELARSGDQRYVASPRVDSFHGVWFELHEDLIQLAGRTRAEEVESGRA
ncbi:MAG TPA: pyruvate, phosphate dikinase [Candidatus Limnocylindrales bacterium]|nr:pyruvate, phosphate dikinase [Candidatus Limnocylindrales bacterium]